MSLDKSLQSEWLVVIKLGSGRTGDPDSMDPHSFYLLASVVEPEPPFLAGAVKKGAAPAPALQLKLQL